MAVAQDKKASQLTVPVLVADTDIAVGYRPAAGANPNLDLQLPVSLIRAPMASLAALAAGNVPVGQIVSVKDYGAVGDSVTDDTAAIQAALNAAVAGGRRLYLPAASKSYLVTSALTAPTPRLSTANASVRKGGVYMVGDGPYTSVIEYTGTGYMLDWSAQQFDSFSAERMSIRTSTGGGIKLADIGEIKFDNYFGDGSSSTEYSVYIDGDLGTGFGAYMISFAHCRFWSKFSANMKHAIYVNNYHTLLIFDTFISNTSGDGPVLCISQGKNCYIFGGALEGFSDTINGKYILFDGSSSDITLNHVYCEGQFGVFISHAGTGGSGLRGLSLKKIRMWQRWSNNAVIPWQDFRLLDMANISGASIDGLTTTFNSSTVSAVPCIVNDNMDELDINPDNYKPDGSFLKPLRASGAVSALRGRGSKFIGTSTTPSFTVQLPRAGSYMLSAAFVGPSLAAGDHTAERTFLVDWRLGSTADFLSVRQLGIGPQTIPFSALRQHDGLQTALPATADSTHMGLTATNPRVLKGQGTSAAGLTTCRASVEMLVPAGYVTGQTPVVTLFAGISANKQVSQTVDVICNVVSQADGTLGSDICTTSPQNLTTTPTAFAFNLDGTALAAGNVLYFEFRLATNDTGGSSSGFPSCYGIKIDWVPVRKGSAAPTDISASVDNAGLVTVTGSGAGGATNWYGQYRWQAGAAFAS